MYKVTPAAGESALALEPEELNFTARTPSLLVAFLLDPDARITREGNVGDGGTRALDARERRRAEIEGLP